MISYMCLITKNLLSISKFTKDNDIVVEFYDDCCLVKDKNTRKILMQGKLKGGFYQLDVPVFSRSLKSISIFCSNFPSVSLASIKSNETCTKIVNTRHSRLSHLHALKC